MSIGSLASDFYLQMALGESARAAMAVNQVHFGGNMLGVLTPAAQAMIAVEHGFANDVEEGPQVGRELARLIERGSGQMRDQMRRGLREDFSALVANSPGRRLQRAAWLLDNAHYLSGHLLTSPPDIIREVQDAIRCGISCRGMSAVPPPAWSEVSTRWAWGALMESSFWAWEEAQNLQTIVPEVTSTEAAPPVVIHSLSEIPEGSKRFFAIVKSENSGPNLFIRIGRNRLRQVYPREAVLFYGWMMRNGETLRIVLAGNWASPFATNFGMSFGEAMRQRLSALGIEGDIRFPDYESPEWIGNLAVSAPMILSPRSVASPVPAPLPRFNPMPWQD